MKHWMAAFIFSGFIAAGGLAAAQGPEVVKVDNKVSVHASNISLGYLLHLWDKATGMHSTIPRELAKRPVSVQFDRLNIQDAVEKIFEKQPLNYAVVEGQGIVVTGVESTASAEPEPVVEPEPEAEPPLEPAVVAQARQKPSVAPVPVPAPAQPPVQPPVEPQIELQYQRDFISQAPFWGIPVPVMPPAGAANGPTQNLLFGPLPAYQPPIFQIPNSLQR
jgi:hypothetical protein